MAIKNYESQAKFLNLHLGDGTRETYQPIIDKVKKNTGLKPFVLRCLTLYSKHPELFK